jgi:NhaP-type Na+/H+ or K+/H+ antiporter
MEAFYWYLAAGTLLCAMAVSATLIQRLPLTTAILYLPIGWALGPHGIQAIRLDLVRDAAIVEQVTTAIILLSIFSAGLKMRLPITNRLWRLSFRLAFLSMALTVALIAASAVLFFGLPWKLAVLLGGILAPTDPVLASDVQVENAYELGAVRFGLTSEAGLNDGSAFPVVLLGLLALTKPLDGAAIWHWVGVDLIGRTVIGLCVGFAVGVLLGKWVIHLRSVHHQAVGRGYFLGPGLIALSYGLAELAHGYGFLAVFASAVALRWIELKGSDHNRRPELPLIAVDAEKQFEAATNPETAPVFLVELLLQFTTQIEAIGEMVGVVMVGALLQPGAFAPEILLRAALLFVLVRPAAVFIGLAGTPLRMPEKGLLGFFGIRGLASLYYLSYAIQRGLPHGDAERLANAVLATITLSVTIHGLSVTPLMGWYSRRQGAK